MNIDHIIVDDTVYETVLTKKYKGRKEYAKNNPKEIRAMIPGVILDMLVKTGTVVQRDDKLLILEAMKMANTITSDIDGKIKAVHVSKDEKVMKNQLLVEFE